MARRNFLPWLTAALALWASLATIAPGLFQLQGSWSRLNWILDPRIAWVLFPIVVGLLLWNLTRVDKRLTSLESEKRDIRQELLRHLRDDILHYQAEAVSIATIREARIRVDIRDYVGAIRAAMECYSAAQSGNMNYIAHVFDAIFDAMTAATHDGVAIPRQELVAVHTMLLNYRKLHADERAVRLKSLVEQYV